MGVFCDYFLATGDGAVAELMARTEGESPLTLHNGQGVDAEGIDPAVALGKVVALILGVAREPGLVPVQPVWEADLECHEGPWVFDVGEMAVRALAGLDDADVPAIVTRLPNTDPEWLTDALRSLAALARRAAETGERLYCWVSM